MKKFLSIFCTTLLLSSQSEAATGVFVGVDVLQSHSNNTSEINGSRKKSDDGGYGFNLGYRFDPAMLFLSGEIFYERLNSSAHGFDQTTNSGPRIRMDDRYGAKANLGITVLPWLTPFITYGVARVDANGSNRKTNDLYGIGLMFDIPATNFSVKAAYDIQKFNVSYPNSRSDTSLGVAHLGVTYTFASE